MDEEFNPKIDAGLELISALGAIELKPIEIRDLLYKLISKNYSTIDKILEAAKKEKLLKLTEKTYLMTPEASSLKFEKPKIVKQEESATCKFCRKKTVYRVLCGFQIADLWTLWVILHSKIYLDYLL